MYNFRSLFNKYPTIFLNLFFHISLQVRLFFVAKGNLKFSLKKLSNPVCLRRIFLSHRVCRLLSSPDPVLLCKLSILDVYKSVNKNECELNCLFTRDTLQYPSGGGGGKKSR